MTGPRHAPQERRLIWPPSPGVFKLRLVRNGWFVPARIDLTEEGWRATIDGTAREPDREPENAAGVAQVWHGGWRSDEAEYRYLVALKEWAQAHDPEHPCLHPRKPIALHRLTPHYAPQQRRE